MNLFPDYAREFRLKMYKTYILYMMNIVRGTQIPDA
jgi:hypothetical protein